MENRIVVVTGAGGGVGQTVTRRWLEAGAKVIGIGSSPEPLKALGEHERLATGVFDLTTSEGANGMVAFAQSRFGTPDTLIHTVGGFGMGSITAEDAAELWERMLALNATSTFHCYRAMAPALRSRGGGWIAGIASRAGVVPAPKMAAYCASKAAMISLTQSLAEELRKENIHINAILPSTIDTPANRAAMGDAHAADWVTPDQIADATFYLCSEAAAGVHGATLELYAKA